MKKLSWIFALILTACSYQPTAETIHATPLPSPTLATVTKPMDEADKEAAREFFYHLKVHIVSSEYEHISEEVRFPITVVVDGQPKTYVYISEFSADFSKIFTAEKIQKIISTDESELVFTSDGISAADGIIWFDLICIDPTCDNAEFMITQINN